MLIEDRKTETPYKFEYSKSSFQTRNSISLFVFLRKPLHKQLETGHLVSAQMARCGVAAQRALSTVTQSASAAAYVAHPSVLRLLAGVPRESPPRMGGRCGGRETAGTGGRRGRPPTRMRVCPSLRLPHTPIHESRSYVR